jgi:hypothetical protein
MAVQLGLLGLRQLKVEADGVAFGAEGLDDFAVFTGRQPTSGAHVAFEAPSREAVDAFYAAALAHGGRHRRAPGVWVQYSERYDAAYVWDPDGKTSRRSSTARSPLPPSRRSANPRTHQRTAERHRGGLTPIE